MYKRQMPTEASFRRAILFVVLTIRQLPENKHQNNSGNTCRNDDN